MGLVYRSKLRKPGNNLIHQSSFLKKMRRYCFALDLKDDVQLIEEYDEHHRNVSIEIKNSITGSGIISMDIYRAGNRLFMIMETDDSFSFTQKEESDKANLQVQEWEQLMWKYQQILPFAKEGEKWVLMSRIFHLHKEEL